MDTVRLLGFGCELVSLREDGLRLSAVLAEIERMNADPEISGIVVQLPLPPALQDEFQLIVNSIAEYKDVDCLNGSNYTNMLFFQRNRNDFWFPCITQAIHHFLQQYQIPVKGQHVVILGQSYLVGYPTLILFQQMNATVNFCNQFTQRLSEHTREADILVSATGEIGLVRADFVKPGSVVFDVGINLDSRNGAVRGDVALDEVS